MDDLQALSTAPLQPPPRKKYLAHSLFGLGPDHKAMLVAQLNGQLHRHAKNRRGVPLPAGGSLRDPVRRRRIESACSLAGWVIGGFHLTVAITSLSLRLRVAGRARVCAWGSN